MSKRKKSKMEYRYYQVPDGSPLLALLGEKWVQTYGEGIDYLHFHNYLEIGYCYEGQGELVIAEQSFRFRGNQFSVIPKNCPHTTNSDLGTVSRWEYLFVDVEGFLQEVYPESSGKRREKMLRRIYARAFFDEAEQMPEIADNIVRLLNIMRKNEEFYLEEAKGVLLSLMAVIARKNGDVGSSQPEERVTDMLSDALEYISGHYMEPVRMEKLASLCHISETHFRRAFSACMKMGPLEYLNMVRIQNACELLKKTDDTAANIAYKCGFTTISTFNRNFRQATGVTPMEWRRQPDNFEQQILKFLVHAERGW